MRGSSRADWSYALLAAIDHAVPGYDLSLESWAVLGYMVAGLEPRVEAAHAADSPDLLDAAVESVLAELLPDSMAALAPAVRLALQAGASALWRSLVAASMRTYESDVITIVEVD